MVQAMLHRVPTGETISNNPQKAATLRAKQLHSRYFAFTHGRFKELLAKEDILGKGDPRRKRRNTPSNSRSGEEKHARSNSMTQPKWQTRQSPTSGMGLWETP
jgi:hypothetical protein